MLHCFLGRTAQGCHHVLHLCVASLPASCGARRAASMYPVHESSNRFALVPSAASARLERTADVATSRSPEAAAARGRLPLPLPRPPSCLAALRPRFSSAYRGAAAARRSVSRFATGSGIVAPGVYSGIDDDEEMISDPICGGIHDAPGHEMDPDAIELARFAVAEHNSKTNAALEFVRLVKVRTQVVAGTMYYFTVEVREVDGGANKLYEAKVWLRPWENFKGLSAFEPVAIADNGETKVSFRFSR